MPDIAQPDFPKSLTTSSWDKAKGLIARISGVKTGVTEELESVAKAYKASASAFKNLNVFTACSDIAKRDGTLADYKKLQDDYLRKLQPEFKKLEGAFYDLSETLKKKAREFENDEKLKKFAPVLTLMANDANKFTYAVAWGTVSSSNQRYLQDLIDNRTKADKQWAEAAGNVKKLIETAYKGLNSYKNKPPKLSEYDVFLRGDLRGIGAQIAMAAKGDPSFKEKYAAPLKIAATLWAQKSMPKEGEIAARILEDFDLVKKFKAIADRD